MIASEAAISQGRVAAGDQVGMISRATGGRKLDTLARVESAPPTEVVKATKNDATISRFSGVAVFWRLLLAGHDRPGDREHARVEGVAEQEPQQHRADGAGRVGGGVMAPLARGHDQPDRPDDDQLEQADQADPDDLADQRLHRPDGGQQHLHDPGRLLLDHALGTVKQ